MHLQSGGTKWLGPSAAIFITVYLNLILSLRTPCNAVHTEISSCDAAYDPIMSTWGLCACGGIQRAPVWSRAPETADPSWTGSQIWATAVPSQNSGRTRPERQKHVIGNTNRKWTVVVVAALTCRRRRLSAGLCSSLSLRVDRAE